MREFDSVQYYLLGIVEMEVKIDKLITMHFWKAFAIIKQIYASSGVANLFSLHPFLKSPYTPFSNMTLLFGVIYITAN